MNQYLDSNDPMQLDMARITHAVPLSVAFGSDPRLVCLSLLAIGKPSSGWTEKFKPERSGEQGAGGAVCWLRVQLLLAQPERSHRGDQDLRQDQRQPGIVLRSLVVVLDVGSDRPRQATGLL